MISGSPVAAACIIGPTSASASAKNRWKLSASGLSPMATIVHFELPSADTDRAKGFYSSVFGWTFGGMTEPFVYLMTEGEEPVGAIFQSDEAGSGPIVYLATDDIDATIAKIREAGGSADG